MEHRRRQLGLSQRDLAARIGISQGQYANAIRGHDPLSAFAVNRLRDVSRCLLTSKKQGGGAVTGSLITMG